MPLEIDVIVEAEPWNAVPAVQDLARRAAGAATFGFDVEDGEELNILLCDDARIRALNSGFRGFDKPTNVLSFPAADAPGRRSLGDIAIAYETVRREADEEGKSVADHLAHMVVHGVLHLLGHDHETDAEAEEMEDLERLALERLGVADPYRGEPGEAAP
jgi:probable rRNA maturation factor